MVKDKTPNCTCANCGKPMYLPKSRLNSSLNHFCSRSCTSSYHMKQKMSKYSDDLNVTCTFCGKKFHRKPSHVGETNFCCKECQTKYWESQKVIIYCAQCGKEMHIVKSDTDKKFCSKECMDNYQRRFRTLEKCAYCGRPVEITRITRRRSVTGKFFCSNKCVGKYFSGENSPSYTGYSDVVKVLRTYYGLRQRPLIFERDKKVCQICGGVAENVHHKYPIYKMIRDFQQRHPEIDMTKDVYLLAHQIMHECPEFLDLNNLISVCEKCHKTLHTEERQRKWGT